MEFLTFHKHLQNTNVAIGLVLLRILLGQKHLHVQHSQNVKLCLLEKLKFATCRNAPLKMYTVL